MKFQQSRFGLAYGGCTLGAWILATSALAANPFGDPGTGDDAGKKAAPAPVAPPDPARMPPGTPSQWGGAVMPGVENTGNQAQHLQQRWLERLSVSSIIGRKILFRVAPWSSQSGADAGPGYAAPSNYGAGSVSAASLGNVSAYSTAGQGSASSAGFVVLRAQDRKPFLLGQEQYVPVLDGFTVLLYKVADAEQRSPVWAGEPTPVRSLVLPPNTSEFANTSSPGSSNVPATVMPSAAFGAGGISSLGVNSGASTAPTTTTGNGNTTR